MPAPTPGPRAPRPSCRLSGPGTPAPRAADRGHRPDVAGRARALAGSLAIALRIAVAPGLGTALLLTGGCTRGQDARPVPGSLLRIDRDRFDQAFDSVLAVAADEGFTVSLVDRRAGIIETEPRHAPSVLEPWHPDGSTLGTRFASTLNDRARRLRFEFVAENREVTRIATEDLPGPDLLGFRADAGHGGTGAAPAGPGAAPPQGPPASDAALVLRAWTWLERSHVPGLRRHPWSRSLTTRSGFDGWTDDEAAWEALRRRPSAGRRGSIQREVVERDPAFERRLLARIESRIRALGGADDRVHDGTTDR